jgi:redox-sensitive bicupin YhaK (pirin superfamily)
MITLRPASARGHADHGWLDARHTFSFADYHDPEHMGFSVLRVLNQDRIAPARGFGTHPHRDMEIVTYVLSGALEHKDSMGNGSLILPGEVQFMSAGTGVFHSEFNASKEMTTELLQMWILPAERGRKPRYDQKCFPTQETEGALRLAVSPDGRAGSIAIGQDASLYVGRFAQGERAELSLGAGRSAWLHVAEGRVRSSGVELGPGDGAAITDEARIAIEGVGTERANVVLWDLP